MTKENFSFKKGIHEWVDICVAHGVKHAVISPGSRCAPLTLAFTRNSKMKCYSIIDERSAAFFALGMAKATQETVVLICTSGSALLNYGPAIAEAFYSDIPLLILSADRPAEFIDIQDGQCIRQTEVFRNFIKGSYQLNGDIENEEEFRHNERILNEALNLCQFPVCGPVHVNVPFHEPLYTLSSDRFALTKDFQVRGFENDLQFDFSVIKNKKSLVIAGQNSGSEKLQSVLGRLIELKGWVVLTEAISNLHSESFINNGNDILNFAAEEALGLLKPDIVITFGTGFVSKQLKKFLRNSSPFIHFHIDPAGRNVNTFFTLTDSLRISPEVYFEAVEGQISLESEQANYQNHWKNFCEVVTHRKEEILSSIGFSDIKVYERIIRKIPSNSVVHFANSLSVRYANIFSGWIRPGMKVQCNRGVSGIDGCVSTAVGDAAISNQMVFVLAGDMAFHYDSNALWNKYIGNNLRIIVVNNSGGGIFYMVDGTEKISELEDWFVTANQTNAKHKAAEFGLNYYSCSSLHEIEDIWPDFVEESNTSNILEVFTNSELSQQALKTYLSKLKSKI